MSKADPLKEQILNQADIVDIVSQYVSLKQKGNRLFGLSPFKKEKTPSFSVVPDKQYYQCFASNKNGNVIDFVMEMENLSFFEAKQYLANKLGIAIPQQQGRKRSHQEIDRFQVMDTAAQLYRNWLKNNPHALEYIQSRGLTQEHLDHFGVGYAPDQWDSLNHALHDRRIPEQVQIELGLEIRRENSSGCYDRFRNRIMFPIRNVLGRVIAFGGRALNPDDPAKYLNSNDTSIFNKSRVLYLLDVAKNHIKDNGVIVVEGYMDAIALHIHGFEYTVATLGTALTKEHIQILKRYTTNFTLLYDSDQAGINAAMRGVELFMESELPVKVLQLQDGKDPDEFLQKNGSDLMKELLSKAPDGFRFYMQQKLMNVDLSTPEGKSTIIKEMLPLLSRIQQGILFDDYTLIMAQYLGGDLDSLKQSLQQAMQSQKTYPTHAEPEIKPQQTTQHAKGTIGTIKRELICLLAYNCGLHAPEDMKSNERINLFSRSDCTDTIPVMMEPLRDQCIEDHLIEKLLALPHEKIENPAAFMDEWLSSQTERSAFFLITAKTDIPSNGENLVKMKREVLDGLQQEVDNRKYQELVRSNTGDPMAFLKAANEQLLGKTE